MIGFITGIVVGLYFGIMLGFWLAHKTTHKMQTNKPKRVLYRGEIYPSQTDLADRLGCSMMSVSKAVRNGWDLMGHQVREVA